MKTESNATVANSKAGICGRNNSVQPGRTPSSLGVKDAADPNTPFCLAGDTPGSLGAGKDYATPKTKISAVKKAPVILCFDLKVVAHFLRTVAIAKAQQYFTHIEWQEYNEDTVINAIYALMPWKGKPGWVVVSQGQPVDVFAKADKDAEELLAAFLKKCSQGPSTAIHYLEQQESIRSQAIAGVQNAVQEAAAINKDVIKETANGITWLAGIKCGADLVVTGIGLASGVGLAGVAVSVGYSVVKEWAKGASADAVAVKTKEEVGKAGVDKLSEVGGKLAYGSLVPPSVQHLSKWDAEASIANKEVLIEKYEKELIGKGAAKKAKLTTRIDLRTAEIEKLNKAASPIRQGIGKTAKIAGSSVKFLFAIKEVVDSIKELTQTLDAAK